MSEEKKKARRCPATALSLEFLRTQGMIAETVERIIPIPGQPFPRKRDLFSIIDIIYVDPERNQVGFVQTTGWSSRGARKAKMLSKEPLWSKSKYTPAEVLLALHNIVSVNVELHAWRKVEGQWEIAVYGPKLERDLVGEIDVMLVPIAAPTMKEARAMGRERQEGGKAACTRKSSRFR